LLVVVPQRTALEGDDVTDFCDDVIENGVERPRHGEPLSVMTSSTRANHGGGVERMTSTVQLQQQTTSIHVTLASRYGSR